MIRGRARRALPSVCLVLAVLALPAAALPVRVFAMPAESLVSAQGGGLFTAFDGLGGDHYGEAVAISANWAVIGAPLEDNEGGSDAGSAYVYRRDWADWKWDAKLRAPDGAADDDFGVAVAVYGDTIVVGADFETSPRGAVYIFTRSGDDWGFPQKIMAPDTATGQQFGCSVAIYQDTMLIGAVGDSDARGAAYVYVRSGGTWVYQTKLTDPTVVTADGFGKSVSLYQDTALVGASNDDLNVGSAWVFTRSGTAWTKETKLTAIDGFSDDEFGDAVSLYRDTAFIGAPGDDDTVGASGSVYVFTRTGTAWAQAQKLHAATPLPGEAFGRSVSVSGGVALVGAPGAGPHSGRTFFFRHTAGSWADVPPAFPGAAVGDRCGYSVCISGGRIAIGVWGDDTVATDAGAAFIAMGEGVHPHGSTRVAGPNRYLTAVEASKAQFSAGAAAIVVATGENWPDALGGSALCGAVYGPMLLTQQASLPTAVADEIVRLGATKAYVLGGTAAVSAEVEDQLVALLGRQGVVRLSGADRYATARAVADEVIRLDGEFDGHVIVATGGDFPDATAVAPVCAYNRAPILLANPRTGTVNAPPQATSATILGGTNAVSDEAEDALDAMLSGSVDRLAGADRYETAALIAQAGVDHGMMWEGVGLASGAAFPDALSGGVMLGLSSSVLLLTPPASLSPYTASKLSANTVAIDNSLRIIGGTSAVSAAAEAQAKTAAGITP